MPLGLSTPRPPASHVCRRRKKSGRLVGGGSTPGNRGGGGERVTAVAGRRRFAGGGSGPAGRNPLPAWRLLAPGPGAEASALFVAERATSVLPLLFPLVFG